MWAYSNGCPIANITRTSNESNLTPCEPSWTYLSTFATSALGFLTCIIWFPLVLHLYAKTYWTQPDMQCLFKICTFVHLCQVLTLLFQDCWRHCHKCYESPRSALVQMTTLPLLDPPSLPCYQSSPVSSIRAWNWLLRLLKWLLQLTRKHNYFRSWLQWPTLHIFSGSDV